MAVYSKLLLSTGGGIISSQQQADQAKNTATVLIGLGGTGVHCLRTIKTQVYNRLKADDPKADVPKYDHIRFIGVDTTKKSRGGALTESAKEEVKKAGSIMSLDDTEFFSIANANLKDALRNELALQQRNELSWLEYKKIGVPDLGDAGAGGIRQIGRFMMMDRSSSFLSKVEQEINAAKRGLASPQVNVHIFSGLSGGTGSGCFLDVCYMVRSIAEKIGGITLYGYFFTPDVNLEKIPYEAVDVRTYIPKNGYAAMQELDYCMNLPKNGGSFEQSYQNFNTIRWDAPPVDMCHLISATDENNNVITNAYEYAMNVTAEYVMDFLTESDKEHGLAEHLANFRQMVLQSNGKKTIGSEMAYCAIGASCASIPLREINTYLASELFDKFGSIQTNVPSKADVETLAVASLTNGETQVVTGIYDSLYRQISDGASNQYGAYQDDWKTVRDYGNSEMVTHYTNQTAAKLNRVEANAKSMLTSGNEKSLLGKVMTQMNYVLRDINRGPIYAYRMVAAAQTHNFLNIIDGLIAENDAKWRQEGLQTELREADYENAKSDFDNRRSRGLFDTDAKRFADYEFYLMALEQHKLYMNIFSKLDGVLRDFRAQLVDITASYYIKLARVMETLINTFAENKEALKNPASMKADDSFAIPMMTIEELKKSLDAEINILNIPGLLDAFMVELVNNPDEWIMEDENKITKMVTKFFVDTAFNGFANRTITSFLKDKYENKYGSKITDEQLTNYVYDEWITTLTDKARPLFAFNGSIWSEAKTSKLAFLSFPSISDPIKNAAKKMYELNNLYTMKESALRDRIFVMSSACGLPLSSYKNCAEYERSYFSTTNPGTHYYEGKPNPTIKFTDWRKLPSVTPQSVIKAEAAPEKLKNQLIEVRDLFEKAHQFGVIDDEGAIYKPDEESVNSIKAACENCAEAIKKVTSPKDIPVLMEAVNNLKNLAEVKLEKTDFSLPEDGYRETNQYVRGIQEDHFIYSPAVHEGVAETLKVVEDLTKLRTETITKAEAAAADIRENSNVLGDYLEALFTGIISYEGRVIVYHQDSLGIKTDFTLCKREDQFKFSAIPPYQGFVSYKKLPKEVREEINKLVDDRLNADAPELYSTGKALKDVFTSDRLTVWNQLASNYEEYSDIVSFVRSLNQSFDNYCRQNGI